MVAQAIAQSPATHVEGLSYRAGTLELHVVAPTVEALDGLQQAMKRNGAKVELLSANQRDKAYEGRLQVRPGSA
jgi:hypothetical protein